MTTGFVEYRFSHLLKKPLRSSGTLEYRADGVLARNVEAPYRESTEVEGDAVRITRDGRPTRTISLRARRSCACCWAAFARCSKAGWHRWARISR